MSSIHLLGGLPRGLFPSTDPSVTILNRTLTSFILTTWPNNPSFLVLMVSITVSFLPILFLTSSFVICSCQLISSIHLLASHFKCQDSFSVRFFDRPCSLQHRGGLRRRPHIVAALSWVSLIPSSLQTTFRSLKAPVANCILLFISSELSLSHVSFAPK